MIDTREDADTGGGIVILARYYDEPSAYIAKAVLEANNIPCVIQGDDAGGMDLQLRFVHGLRLYVREEDVGIATELLELRIPGSGGGS